MSALTDLISQIENPELRVRIQAEIDRANKQKKFGLVFEEHLPESTPLYDVPIKVGGFVSTRSKGSNGFILMKVISISDGIVQCITQNNEISSYPINELVTVAPFGEPIYPYLKPIDSISNAPDSELWHTLIEADNYHALQLLEYLYAGKVDCIYIDPPYNTGARDWKYNNDYVDSSDSYRHSKWLSMMQKRLKIAKKLLNPSDSVLVVTIDEKEYLHLGCLLEEMFPEARIQMVSSVISSQGSTRDGLFSRADEYLFFVFMGSSEVKKSEDDMLNEGQSATKSQLWFQFVRTGKGNLRENSKNLFYPIYIDPSVGKILRIGEPIALNVPKETILAPDGETIIWPETADGREARWRTGVDVARRRLSKGLLRLGKTSKKESGWSVLTVNEGTEERIDKGEVIITGYDFTGGAQLEEVSGGSLRAPKTVWNKISHNAGWHGSKLLAKILLDRKFPYPKSLYAVADTINIVTRKNDALILDFFAGSGTTLHAVNLLNAIDGGKRQCIIVTNNEVSEEESQKLRKLGLVPGDVDWEKYGIAHDITWPRTVHSILGTDISDQPLQGEYLDYNLPLSKGFRANAVFFKLGFLDNKSVALGRQFKELLPVLWMKAGAIGPCPKVEEDILPEWLILSQNKMAILLDETTFPTFEELMREQPDIRTLYLVTDSEKEFVAMSTALGIKDSYQIYRDYLDNFRINRNR